MNLFFLAPWLVFAPVLGLLINGIFGGRFSEKVVGTIASAASGAAFVVSLLLAFSLAVLMLWYVVSPRFGGSRGARFANATIQAAAVALTWTLALAWFATDGAAVDFLRFTLFDNLRWKSETTAGTILRFIARYEPWLFALAAGGAWVAEHGRVRSLVTLEKVMLVGLISLIYGQILPGLRSTNAELFVGLCTFVVINTAITLAGHGSPNFNAETFIGRAACAPLIGRRNAAYLGLRGAKPPTLQASGVTDEGYRSRDGRGGGPGFPHLTSNFYPRRGRGRPQAFKMFFTDKP